MDRGTLIGFLLGVGLLVWTIAVGPNPRIFLHPQSLVVVFGGIMASTLIRFPLSNVRSALAVASRAFFTQAASPHTVVTNLVALSQRARREGILGLEKHLPDDQFMRQGIRMVVDRVGRDYMHEVLDQEIHATQERHVLGQEIFRFIAVSAPSFGMVGTLIGMVQLFVSIKDPAGIGQGMALSLLSHLLRGGGGLPVRRAHLRQAGAPLPGGTAEQAPDARRHPGHRRRDEPRPAGGAAQRLPGAAAQDPALRGDP